MDHFFKNSDDNDDIMDFNEKISLDELYDRKREIEINRMNIYRKILRRIHNKIKTVSRQNCDTFFFFIFRTRRIVSHSNIVSLKQFFANIS